eukprot:CAMPEP_0203009190 /NCGR_PEP_ID=MMETSP1401-20130829/8936_1 /ASSEMBLY_ACC=CAM_ASM_000894 /TAXON_ID=38833 /ORGANISM="Micromonas pusilla, Strain CCAC1681" /LENGTH=75 /DNA_ID=CAMNT_0049750855 /DNA_START=168 /DNA_END=392 /DNA_ORIENTATION=+
MGDGAKNRADLGLARWASHPSSPRSPRRLVGAARRLDDASRGDGGDGDEPPRGSTPGASARCSTHLSLERLRGQA